MASKRTFALALLLAGWAASVAPAAEVQTGDPQLKSIEAITFGPEGLLLIGDGRGAQVVAVQTGDTTPTKWVDTTKIDDLRGHLAARLGTTAKGIEILKMAVNPASQVAYLAVRKLDGKQDLILTVDGAGKVREFAFDKVKFTRYTLPPGEKSPITKVTDITYADGRILLAAQATGTFASKIIVIDPEASKDAASFVSTETYHVAHGRWETNAPIRTVIPYVENGKKYLVGAFTCTPIVKYSLENLSAGGRVKGTSVIELGNGNTPQYMFVYERDGKKYILMNHYRMFHKQNPVGPSPYWTAKVDYEILVENQKINENAVRRVGNRDKASQSNTERAQIAADYHGVVHMARLGGDRVLVVRTDDKGGQSLGVLPLP
jgi:hypothetical protein